MYTILRECWNEKTYNGYVDSPYWRIGFDSYTIIGLTDNGEYWGIGKTTSEYLKDNKGYIEMQLKKIIAECHLQINDIKHHK